MTLEQACVRMVKILAAAASPVSMRVLQEMASAETAVFAGTLIELVDASIQALPFMLWSMALTGAAFLGGTAAWLALDV